MVGQAAQLDLFDQPAPHVDIQRALKAAVGRALNGCGLSRQHIAECMNEFIKEAGGLTKVTPAKLDAWARPSDATHNIPAHMVHVFCLVTGNTEPIEVMLSPLNLYPIGPRERLYIVAAQAEEASKKGRQARACRPAGLGGDEGMKQAPRCVLIGKWMKERGTVKTVIQVDSAWAKQKRAK